MIKFGIIGFGGMGYWHFENASKIAGVQFVAAHDINTEALEDAKRSGLKTYDTLESFLGDPDIDAVLISASNPAHKELVIAAARAKKAIICEKPAALSVSDFDEMVACAKENNVLLTVHQNRRWDKDFRTVKTVIESGTLGNVFHITSRLYGIFGYVHGWHCFKDQGGGMLFDWGVHLIDQILQLIPEKLVSVWSDMKVVVNSEVDDYFKLLLRFESGQCVEIELGTLMLHGLPRWYVAGDKGTAIVNSFAGDGRIIRTVKEFRKLPIRIADTTSGPTRTYVPTSDEDFRYEALPEVSNNGWTEFYRNFMEVMESDAKPAVQLDQVRRVLRVMDAARLSAQQKQEIAFVE